MSVVILKYQDLVDGKDLSSEIQKAYGPHGLGALLISGIPEFMQQRQTLLPLGHKLAHFPKENLNKLEDPKSQWNAGWSHGREKLGDTPDNFKGSFYANPLFDHPARSAEEKAAFPTLVPDNIWPKNDMPDLEPAFKTLGKSMYDVVLLLAKQVDLLVSRAVPTYKPDTLLKELERTRKVKGRLLYYYPTDTDSEDGWIGWHNDSGYLTALTSAMFFNDETGEQIPNPDPQGGLWIVNRGSEPVHVKIPADHLAVQCGECLQVITGGLLVATPHAVRASKCPKGVKVGRATFPVFIDTNIDVPMSAPEGVSRARIFDATPHSKVPPLDRRFTRNGMLFSEFLSATFNQFYAWNLETGNKGPVMM